MKTVVLGPPPPELASFIAKRQALGLDRYDEVWEGAYHMAPAAHSWHGAVAASIKYVLAPAARAAGLHVLDPFNLGTSEQDFRVPAGGLHRSVPNEVWVDTAALVLEVLSPDDETWEKFAFYARQGVDEILIADPRARTLRWFVRQDARYHEVDASPLLGVSVREVAAAVDWPS